MDHAAEKEQSQITAKTEAVLDAAAKKKKEKKTADVCAWDGCGVVRTCVLYQHPVLTYGKIQTDCRGSNPGACDDRDKYNIRFGEI